MPDRLALISWAAAVLAGILGGGFFLNLFWPPNYGELALSIGAGLSVMAVLRRVVQSELEKRYDS